MMAQSIVVDKSRVLRFMLEPRSHTHPVDAAAALIAARTAFRRAAATLKREVAALECAFGNAYDGRGTVRAFSVQCRVAADARRHYAARMDEYIAASAQYLEARARR